MKELQRTAMADYATMAMARYWIRLQVLEKEKQDIAQSIKRIETELQKLLTREF